MANWESNAGLSNGAPAVPQAWQQVAPVCYPWAAMPMPMPMPWLLQSGSFGAFPPGYVPAMPVNFGNAAPVIPPTVAAMHRWPGAVGTALFQASGAQPSKGCARSDDTSDDEIFPASHTTFSALHLESGPFPDKTVVPFSLESLKKPLPKPLPKPASTLLTSDAPTKPLAAESLKHAELGKPAKLDLASILASTLPAPKVSSEPSAVDTWPTLLGATKVKVNTKANVVKRSFATRIASSDLRDFEDDVATTASLEADMESSTTASESLIDSEDSRGDVMDISNTDMPLDTCSRAFLLDARQNLDNNSMPIELQSLSAEEVLSPNALASGPLMHRGRLCTRKAASNATLSCTRQLRRDVNSLLNKVCPENVATIIQRVVDMGMQNACELQVVIDSIFRKALAEPHYCETYADMVVELKQRLPEFQCKDSEAPVTFLAVLVSAIQREFESLSDVLILTAEETQGLGSDEISLLKKARKDRVLANIKFIGQLYLRSILSTHTVGSIIQGLAKCSDESSVPEEPMIECICELLNNIGFTLEQVPTGKDVLSIVCSRLLNLKQLAAPSGAAGRGLYSKRIQFAIEDILESRSNGWARKTFKASAKTKEEIRREQEKDLLAQACGLAIGGGQMRIVGARPARTAAASGH